MRFITSSTFVDIYTFCASFICLFNITLFVRLSHCAHNHPACACACACACASCPFGIVCIRHRVHSASCPFGIVSVSASCPFRHRVRFGIVSVSTSCPFGIVSFGILSIRHRVFRHRVFRHNVRSRDEGWNEKCLRNEVSLYPLPTTLYVGRGYGCCWRTVIKQ